MQVAAVTQGHLLGCIAAFVSVVSICAIAADGLATAVLGRSLLGCSIEARYLYV